ncbi:hypothetical protein Goshw_014542 [Gossypium schwendimanii]|uniref:Dirigent protein n=1 Tax=Gossypium schwendimanii TaxID=34291 RepID=A0A7J9LN28_GOSSC|nr:hypothetical protein [Gossypium schwendimanii]
MSKQSLLQKIVLGIPSVHCQLGGLRRGRSHDRLQLGSIVDQITRCRGVAGRRRSNTLMYLANNTRPDIAFVVNLLARFSYSPTRRHWNGIKHVSRYLRGTIDMRAQEIYAFASQHDFGLLMLMNFAFPEGMYNGSAVSIVGRNAILYAVRKMPLSEVVEFSGLAVARLWQRQFGLIRMEML